MMKMKMKSKTKKGDAKRPRTGRGKLRKKLPKFILPKDAVIEYKNISLLQKFLTDRGKIVSRRVSGISARGQRQLSIAVKRARYLGLLSVGSMKKF
jgi:small subunit ribosomal protein S18